MEADNTNMEGSNMNTEFNNENMEADNANVEADEGNIEGEKLSVTFEVENTDDKITKESIDESNVPVADEENISQIFKEKEEKDIPIKELDMPETAFDGPDDEPQTEVVKEEPGHKEENDVPVIAENVKELTEQGIVDVNIGRVSPAGSTITADIAMPRKSSTVTVGTDKISEKISIGAKVSILEQPEVIGKRAKHRKSNVSKQRSIAYELKPRFREEEELHRPSGDFRLATDEDTDTTIKYYKYMEDAEEEEELVDEIEVEQEIITIDRQPYYQKHEILTTDIRAERIKNNILQKKLGIFFKRRKMDHVLRETDQQFDTQHKYGKKLDTYGELIEVDYSQRDNIVTELELLREKREVKFNELDKLFITMQEREKEIGYGLINTKTGNSIPDKLVERLIRRQKVQMDQVCAMRLKFIQLKDMVAEKQDAITHLDKIGDGLHLMDYEQLKVENRSHSDKIEERDEELTRLRFKCQNTIQILAHIREKSAALESDIDDIKDEITMVELQSIQAREQLNGLKQERDSYRLLTNKLRSESGLLTQPELLRDMENSMEELKLTSVELEQLKEENKNKAKQIRNIRKNIEFSSDGLMKKSVKILPSKQATKPLVYKGRPSLYKPTLPEKDSI